MEAGCKARERGKQTDTGHNQWERGETEGDRRVRSAALQGAPARLTTPARRFLSLLARMLLPLLRGSCFPPSSPGGGGGGLGTGSPALSGGQARRRKQPPRPADFKLQVIIIGSRGVGKTSLMERFTDDTFCEACKSTVGVDFKIKNVELRGKKIRLQIWDTAGQERFNSITSAYYRSAKGIILVYDITKKETFDDLPKWMKMIDKYASEDAELLLVGNKLDCETDREISRQQGEKFAQQITGMRFCEASAKDNFNVDEIFLKLVDDILKKMPLDILRNELSNSILSLQPEPEIPPELPPPRPHVRCC
ncbi:PREDICTED: ras-related protein Rab-12-like [Chrysochloris asiatica]|uniref:Ras-related protein Rab-12 n=1 Tax=Chrysochloris asiatica TaxID=185453 RepID=A0A9B0TVX9_CHRAS|nr:PREDICTED: ras-related protein Rab-12-like [Chrysochloris asiatica]